MKDLSVKKFDLHKVLLVFALPLFLFSCGETNETSGELPADGNFSLSEAQPPETTLLDENLGGADEGNRTAIADSPHPDELDVIVVGEPYLLIHGRSAADTLDSVVRADEPLSVAGGVSYLGGPGVDSSLGGRGGHGADSSVRLGDDELIVFEQDRADLDRSPVVGFDKSAGSTITLAIPAQPSPPPASELPPFSPESAPPPPPPTPAEKPLSAPDEPPADTRLPLVSGAGQSAKSDFLSLRERKANNRSLGSPPAKPQFAGRKRPLEMLQKSLSSIAFNTPEKIPYGEPSYIQFLMDPSLGRKELANKIKEKGPVETASISITREMEVTLTGEDFSITPISETKQMVLPSETTEWKWSIVPQRPGKNRVHLVVNSILTIEGKEMKRSRSFDRYIEIEVTGIQRTFIFIEDNWHFLALGFVPVALFLPSRSLRLWRNRKAGAKLSQGKHDETRPIDVFVSYSSRDRVAVLRLVESLRGSGFNVWVDQGGLHGASQWSEQIVEAIGRTASFLLVCSPASFASHNVVKETSLASEQNKPIIPLFIEETEIPQSLQYQLAGLQRIEYSEQSHGECTGVIAEALGKLGLPSS